MIAIIDYGAGNLRSIRRALEANGADTVVTDDPDLLARADGVVLPGVGHAGHAMRELDRRGLLPAISEAVEAGKPFLGICLGMQLLFEHQGEGDVQGLGLLEGNVREIEGAEKLPHIGWNRSSPVGSEDDETSPYYYFVHTFAANPADPSVIAETVSYGEEFPSVIKSGNVWGTQFHPEKSGPGGLTFLGDWIQEVDRVSRSRPAIDQ